MDAAQKNSSVLAVAACLLLACCLISRRNVAAQAPCTNPPVEEATNGATWPRGQEVSVFVRAGDFPTQGERDAIAAAFSNWQNSNGPVGNNSGVTFTVTVVEEFPPPGPFQYRVLRDAGAVNGAVTNVSHSGGIVDRASTPLHPDITDPNVITDLLAHEIGHTFGLGDCLFPECSSGQSIMGGRTCTGHPDRDACERSGRIGTHGPYPGLQGPTPCDNQVANDNGVAKAGYPPLPTPVPCSATETWACADRQDNDCDGDIDELDGDCVCRNGGYSGMDHDGDGYCDDMDCDDWDLRYPSQGHCPYSPILVDTAGDGFDLTDAAGGVNFDLDGAGPAERLSWTAAGSDDGWLTLDRNGNGVVDSGCELFGKFTPQPPPPAGAERNGFLALAEFDRPANGGNADGAINSRDAVFGRLRLWRDSDRDGVSEPGELFALPALGIAALNLDYKESKRTDRHGNRFKYRAKVRSADGAQLGRWAWDVFLVRAR